MIRRFVWLAVAFVLSSPLLLAAGDPASKVDWFASAEPLSVRLDAPFNDLFAHAQQNRYAVRGQLIWTEGGRQRRIADVKVTVRGNTSRRETECTFPKLKVAWAGGSVKIGTHCGNESGSDVTAKFGRLPNQNSPIREAFVYRLLDTLGVPTLRARPARITYTYTDADGERPESITRAAFLLEDDDAARERLGASGEITQEEFTTAREAFTPADAARIAFGEALIGNFDWCLRFFARDTYRCDARHPLWNLLAFTWPDGRMRPLMYDFDVSGAVAGYHRWFADIFNGQFMPSRPHAAVEVTAQLQRARTLFDRVVLDATRREFTAKREAAYRALADSNVDADGKKIFTEYMDPFFEAMTSDEVFYRPVVTAVHTRAYADAGRTMPVCASIGSLPVGTPVGEVLQSSGDMVQVVVLDALWKYAPPVKCGLIHDKPVWIARTAIGTEYP